MANTRTLNKWIVGSLAGRAKSILISQNMIDLNALDAFIRDVCRDAWANK